MSYEWTGLSYQEKLIGNQTYMIFALSITLVFLVLAAQYESWTDPARSNSDRADGVGRNSHCVIHSQIAGRPLHPDRSGADDRARREECDPHRRVCARTQSGRDAHGRGGGGGGAAALPADLDDLDRVHLGVVPLVTANGAGAASQQSLGTVVFGGMIASTLLAIPFVPVFYVLVHRVSERFSTAPATAETVPAPSTTPAP